MKADTRSLVYSSDGCAIAPSTFLLTTQDHILFHGKSALHGSTKCDRDWLKFDFIGHGVVG